jgi:KDO2-lipid IV(A) lauroyltransferase
MMENLRLAFGKEKPDAELLKIAEASMASIIKLVCELVRNVPAGAFPERFIEKPEMEAFLQWMKKEKGAIAIVSHFGNWEWLSIPIRPFGLFTNAVGRPLKNPYVYAYLCRLREAANLKNIEKSGAVKDSIACLKRKEIVAVLIDQHESRGAMWVDFFGRKASTSTLPAMLALKYGTPVFPAFFYRNEQGRSTVKYGPEFPLIRTGDLQADLLANTQQYVSKIEEEIRKRPGDWLWAHRRWRTPPPGI